MYTDIRSIKATTARAYGAKIGSTTMMPIINKIKSAAAGGETKIKILFKDYPMLNNNKENIDYLITWAKLCGYITASYENCLYIKWY